MIGWLQNNVGALANRHGLDAGLETQSGGFIGQPTLQPPEIWRLSFAPFAMPEFACTKEVLFAQRDPRKPNERSWPVDDREKNAAEDKEVLVIQHTLVGRKFAARIPLSLWQRKPNCGSARAEAHWQLIVVLPASGANEACH